jgi:hypothetical protein
MVEIWAFVAGSECGEGRSESNERSRPLYAGEPARQTIGPSSPAMVAHNCNTPRFSLARLTGTTDHHHAYMHIIINYHHRP